MAISDASGKGYAASDTEHEQLKLLFDYTKFHIGLYTTLVTLLIAFIKLGPGEPDLLQQISIALTVLLFVLAGACGGVVASNIPHYRRFSDFMAAPIGPRWLRAERWTKKSRSAMAASPLAGANWVSCEHAFFWLGIASAVIGAGLNLFGNEMLATQSQPCNEIFLECRSS